MSWTNIFVIVFLILALVSAIMAVYGFFCARLKFKSQPNKDQFPPHQQSVDQSKIVLSKQWSKTIGKKASAGFAYELSDLIDGAKRNEGSTRAHFLMAFGFCGFILFTFLAIGIDLISSGSNIGMVFVGMVVFFVWIIVHNIRLSYKNRGL